MTLTLQELTGFSSVFGNSRGVNKEQALRRDQAKAADEAKHTVTVAQALCDPMHAVQGQQIVSEYVNDLKPHLSERLYSLIASADFTSYIDADKDSYQLNDFPLLRCMVNALTTEYLRYSTPELVVHQQLFETLKVGELMQEFIKTNNSSSVAKNRIQSILCKCMANRSFVEYDMSHEIRVSARIQAKRSLVDTLDKHNRIYPILGRFLAYDSWNIIVNMCINNYDKKQTYTLHKVVKKAVKTHGTRYNFEHQITLKERSLRSQTSVAQYKKLAASLTDIEASINDLLNDGMTDDEQASMEELGRKQSALQKKLKTHPTNIILPFV